MGDVGEMGAALRDCRKDRHAEWHAQNLAALRASGLRFVERETAVLFREAGKPRVDFFPHAGRWRVVGAGKTKTMRGGAEAGERVLRRNHGASAEGRSRDYQRVAPRPR